MGRNDELLVFLGPSLPRAEAEALAPGCQVLPPARQGDLLRACVHQPRVIALVDGVFEAQPSVWHRELLAVMDAGVTLLGASSMGALRAAELAPFGMLGVGTIFDWLVRGVIEDDAEVALLHASAEHDFRPLTLPLVNVRHAVAEAVKEEVLSSREAAACVASAEAIFYQERTWPKVVATFSVSVRRRWEAWAEGRGRLPDLKREDAILCIQVAAKQVRSNGGRREQDTPVREVTLPSTWLRRARLEHGCSRIGEDTLPNAAALEVLRGDAEADALATAGLRRTLLAGWARVRGLEPDAERVEALFEEWHAHLAQRGETGPELLSRLGMDSVQARELLEDIDLESQLLGLSSQMLPDGPSYDDALVSEARVTGSWMRALSQAGGTRARRSRAPRNPGGGSGSR